MNCAILVLERLQMKYGLDLKDCINECKLLLNHRGLCMIDLVETLHKHQIEVLAIKSLTLQLPCPYIAYYRYLNSGHYVLIEHIGKRITIYDPQFGSITVPKWEFYLKWSKVALVFNI